MGNAASGLENWKKLNGGKLPKWKVGISRYFKYQHEGENVKPPWMGIAYYDFNTDREWLYLIPFNFFIGWIRNGYHFIRYRYYPLKWEKEKTKVYMQGYQAGRKLTELERNSNGAAKGS